MLRRSLFLAALVAAPAAAHACGPYTTPCVSNTIDWVGVMGDMKRDEAIQRAAERAAEAASQPTTRILYDAYGNSTTQRCFPSGSTVTCYAE